MELSIREKNELIFDPLVCIRCGYCKSTCPTYLATRDERFSPRGRLILSQKLLEGVPNFVEEVTIYNDLDTCSKCLECERICPINLRPWFNFVRIKSKTFMGKVESRLARLLVSSKFFFRIVFYIAMSKSFKERHEKIEGNSSRNIACNSSQGSDFCDTLFFPTCFGYTIFCEERRKFQYLFGKLGINFKVLSEKFLCCGAPLLFCGDLESFKENAKKFTLKVKKCGLNPDFGRKQKLVVMGGTCSWVIRDFLIPENFEDLKSLEVHEATDFIVLELEKAKERKKKKFFPQIGRFLLHKPCHNHSEALERFFCELGLSYEVTDFYCCGFGGSLFFKHKRMSNFLGRDMVRGKDFEFIVSSSPGCIIQLSKFAKVYHPIELVFTIAQDL